ncbi:HU family DNA-binding protein [Desulfoferrobacter suflitae]|uniref:HU family DNA-binding protein n=1 Tax=Desulfoferrobacter suflitae TaxID=2865782 RepID=UPI002164E4E9|nr:HU family DNA-binding protein [Desulfoferrobacter suflitae]MCK8604406.1 HU family DNA-binding protein [Desulfoferrobacter suflitae]
MANKQDIARALAENRGISFTAALQIIGTVIDILGEVLIKREPVQLTGFGTFEPVTRKARTGRNPKTGEPVSIPEKTTVRFRPSKKLIEVHGGPKASAR